MADYVYKQMINKVNNTPIVGGTFFLRNVETLDSYLFDELPNDPSGSTQGRYVTADEVPNGVYKVFRTIAGDDIDTGDEVHVEPGRVMHGGSGGDPFYPPVSRVVGDVVHVAGFIPDGVETPAASYITDAMTWAIANGYGAIKVGGFKGSSTWSGATQITIPDGIFHIDLEGATISCTFANLTPLKNESSGLHISNGNIQGNGTGATHHVESESPVLYTNVRFVGFSGGVPQTGFTTTMSSGVPTDKTVYIDCVGVRHDGGKRSRSPGSYGYARQLSIGRENSVDTGGTPPAAERTNVAFADAEAIELSQWIRGCQDTSWFPSGTGATPTAFGSMIDVASAIRYLWSILKPAVTSDALLSANVVYKGDLSAQFKRLRWDGLWTSAVNEIVGLSTGSSNITGVTQGFTVKKMRHFADTAYDDIVIDLTLSWAAGSGGDGLPNAYWRPYQVDFSSTFLKAALLDKDGVSQILPGLWNGKRIVDVQGTISQCILQSSFMVVTARITGGELVDDTINSKFNLIFDNIIDADNVQLKNKDWLNNLDTPTGSVVMQLTIRFKNPLNTNIPRIG